MQHTFSLTITWPPDRVEVSSVAHPSLESALSSAQKAFSDGARKVVIKDGNAAVMKTLP